MLSGARPQLVRVLSSCIHTRLTLRAARIELSLFLMLYFISLALQLITTSSFLEQGTTALVAITAVHAGVVAALFWTLLGEWCNFGFRGVVCMGYAVRWGAVAI